METSLKDPVDSGWLVVPRSTECPCSLEKKQEPVRRREKRRRLRGGMWEPTLPTGSLGTDVASKTRTVTHGPGSVKATRSAPRPCVIRPAQYIYAATRRGKFLTGGRPDVCDFQDDHDLLGHLAGHDSAGHCRPGTQDRRRSAPAVPA